MYPSYDFYHGQGANAMKKSRNLVKYPNSLSAHPLAPAVVKHLYPHSLTLSQDVC